LNWHEYNAKEIIEKYRDTSYNKFETVLLTCCRQTIKCNQCIENENRLLRREKIEIEKKQELFKKLDYKIEKQPWNDFWQSLKSQLISKGNLSEKQIYHINKPIYIF